MCFAVAPYVPSSVGWEHGLLENSQVILLFMGGAIALRNRLGASQARWQFTWAAFAVMWLLLIGKEFSWGATLLTPVSFNEEMGPTFPSSAELPYRPAIPFLLAMVVGVIAWTAIKTKQAHLILDLYSRGRLPIIEVTLFLVLMVVSAATEGHMGFHFSMSKSVLQILEETVELLAYSTLLIAQFRMSYASK